MADIEPAGQSMRIDSEVQRGSPQGLASIFKDIVEDFPNPYKNRSIHHCHLQSADTRETIRKRLEALTRCRTAFPRLGATHGRNMNHHLDGTGSQNQLIRFAFLATNAFPKWQTTIKIMSDHFSYI
jgi:hypothetical protein